MTRLHKWLLLGLAAALLALGWGLWLTQPATPAAHSRNAPGQALRSATGIDASLWTTAQRLSAQALTPDEQALAQAALRDADHALDAAFNAALRDNEAHPPVLGPAALKIEERLQASQKMLAADQSAVAALEHALESARSEDRPAIQDQLELLRSQMELDRDEVQEAGQDLMDAGGNQHQRIQMMMQEHAAVVARSRTMAASRAPVALGNLHGLVQKIRAWLALRRKEHALELATAEALAGAEQLAAERTARAARLEAQKLTDPVLARHSRAARGGVPAAAPGPAAADVASSAGAAAGSSLLDVTRRVTADQKILNLLDQRITDRRELADTYTRWSTLAQAQSSAALHAVLASICLAVGIVFGLMLLDAWLDRLLARTHLDRRQAGTVRGLLRVALQITGVLAVLLVLVGVPGQLGTMLGIVGAGLTVALKDFIVAFIGWVVLMGKNGMRLGDWVEINGVSGEVVELNMFHTVLLETGNWTDAGHPTGRRVTFTNSFAIQGHYFNFSTSGQWLWDELLVSVPYDRDPNAIGAALYKEVVEATTESAKQAESEWRRSVRTRRDAAFSATPGLVVRPAVGGMEIAVRYVTRASERFALRARLYQAAVQLLAQAPRPA